MADIINVTEDTRVGVLSAFWNYIKVNGLQDKTRSAIVKMDAKLMPVMGFQEVAFANLPEVINQFLLPADPITLYHTISVEQPSVSNMQAFDIDIDLDDVSLKQKISQTLLMYSNEAQTSISALDDEVCCTGERFHKV